MLVSNLVNGLRSASVVCAGAPDEAVLQDWLETGVKRLLLLEPVPDRMAELQEVFGAWGAVTLRQAALTGSDGKARLRVYNFPGLRGLTSPTAALHGILPGLKQRATHDITTLAPKTVLEEAGDLTEPICLMINSPGEAYAILQGWQDAGALERVSRIWLRCGSEPMFDGASSCDDLLEWCQAHGFLLRARDDSDLDWPELLLERDPMAQALKTAQARISELEAELSDKARALGSARTEARNHGKKLEVLEKELVDKAALLAKREADAKTLALRIAELEAELTAKEASLEKAQDESRTHAGRIEALEQQLEQQAEALDSAKADTSVALRMQMLTQSDLHDLQERYQTCDQVRRHQEGLLQQLTPRLQQASQELQRLALTRGQAADPATLAAPPADPVAQDIGEAEIVEAPEPARKKAPQRTPRRNKTAPKSKAPN